MASNFFIFTLIVLLCYSLTEIHGQIQCYNCNSYTDGRACLDPMSPNVPIITCASNFVCTKVSYVTQKIFVTSRSCDPGSDTCNSIRRTLQGMYPDLASFQCSTCSRSLCNSNSAVIVNVSLSVLVFSAILSKLF